MSDREYRNHHNDFEDKEDNDDDRNDDNDSSWTDGAIGFTNSDSDCGVSSRKRPNSNSPRSNSNSSSPRGGGDANSPRSDPRSDAEVPSPRYLTQQERHVPPPQYLTHQERRGLAKVRIETGNLQRLVFCEREAQNLCPPTSETPRSPLTPTTPRSPLTPTGKSRTTNTAQRSIVWQNDYRTRQGILNDWDNTFKAYRIAIARKNIAAVSNSFREITGVLVSCACVEATMNIYAVYIDDGTGQGVSPRQGVREVHYCGYSRPATDSVLDDLYRVANKACRFVLLQSKEGQEFLLSFSLIDQ